jgi:hypothetical protein
MGAVVLQCNLGGLLVVKVWCGLNKSHMVSSGFSFWVRVNGMRGKVIVTE